MIIALVNALDKLNFTPLYLAIEHTNNVKVLIENGADINIVGKYGYTPLRQAAFVGNNDVIDFLIDENTILML